MAGLLASAYVDDSLNLPDLFVLRFRDPNRIVLSKGAIKIGAAVAVSVLAGAAQAPELLISGEVTTLEVEFDTGGTFTVVRGYDHAHRLFRGRHTEAYVQMTASDIATKVARRANLEAGTIEATTTVFDHVSQFGVTDWQFLDRIARDIGYEVAVRECKLDFRPPRQAGDAPESGGAADSNPLVLKLGTDLLRFRAVVTSAEQVKEVQVRGWDVAQKQALVATAPAKTSNAVLPAVTPEALASAVGDPVYVATDISYGSQAEVDVAAKAIAEQIAGAFAEFEGVARGNPSLRAGAAFSIDNVGAPFDGKYTITTSRHVYDPETGYTTALSVTGRQDRSLYGLAAGGTRGGGSDGVVIGQVSDANDPQQQGRVTLTFPWLSDDYVSDWARTVQAGAGKDRGAMVVPEVGDEVLVAFDGSHRPYVLGGMYNGVDTPKSSAVSLLDGGSGAINRRSLVSRQGHRIDLLDEEGKTEGVALATKDDKLRLVLDSVGTKVTVHADGTVLIEGSQGIVIDSAGAKLELKGGEISVSASGQLSLKGATAALQASTDCTISGAMVKIN